MKNPLKLQRVSYGKSDTPRDKREYKIIGIADCPVGTLKEFTEFAKANNYDGLQWKELDGLTYEKDFTIHNESFDYTDAICKCGEYLDGALFCPKCSRNYDGL